MYNQFNDLALVFLSRMEATFPQEQKIKVYKQKYIITQGLNAKKPVEMFMENIYDYGEKILSKDENFFKQKDLVGSAESISGKIGLINYWDTMNQATKNAIWEHIQGLYILGMGCLGRQEDLQLLIKKTGFTG